ncbi:hypothetical protein JXA84_03810 [candidate division WOR-3 bacterium]|nr:hypothetical protein [candidate division WOR-3 bacterium]
MLDSDIKAILKEIQKMRRIGEHERALEVIENLYKTEKDLDKGIIAFLQYQKGLIYSKRKEKEKAMDSFAIAIDYSKSATQKVVIQAANSEVLGHLVDAYYSLKNLSLQKSSAGEKNMADSLINEMLKTNNVLRKSIEFVEKIDESKIDDKIAEEIGNLLKVNKNDPYIWCLFGKYHSSKGKYDKALNCFEKGTSSQLKKFESLVGAVHCHIMLGNVELAKINLKAARETAKTDQEIADLEKIEQLIEKIKPKAAEEPQEDELLIEHSTTMPPPPPEDFTQKNITQDAEEEDDFKQGDLLSVVSETAPKSQEILKPDENEEEIETEGKKETHTQPDLKVPPPPPDDEQLEILPEKESSKTFEEFEHIDEVEKSALWVRTEPEKKTDEKYWKNQKKYERKLSLLNSVVSILVFLSFASGIAAGVIIALKLL